MAATETQPVRFFVKVVSGPDEGKVARLTDSGCLLGRSDEADLILTDPDAGFEHAIVSVASGRAWIENLAAKGTRVGGRVISAKTSLVDGDIAELTDATRVQMVILQDRVEKPSLIVPICIVALVLVGVGMLVAKVKSPRRRAAPVLQENWRDGFQRIDNRMEHWLHKGLISPDIVAIYEQAWLRDRSGNDREALRLWERAQSMMMTTYVPGAMDEGNTFASHAGPTVKTLAVIMGCDPNERPDSFQWSSDEAIADAAWWFAARRVVKLKERLQDNE